MIPLINKRFYLTTNGTRVQLLGYNGQVDDNGDAGLIKGKGICTHVVKSDGSCPDNPDLSLAELVGAPPPTNPETPTNL